MENAESEKTKEQLIGEASEMIYQNLLESGLAEKICKISIPSQPFTTDIYMGVEFRYSMTTGKGVLIQPIISRGAGYQAVVTKIYRLNEDGAEKIIWNRVGVAHQRALILSAIEYQVAKQQGELASVERMREGGVSESSIERTVREANQHLEILQKLERSLNENALEMNIDGEYAALTASIKD